YCSVEMKRIARHCLTARITQTYWIAKRIKIYRRLPRLCFAARNHQSFEKSRDTAWQPGFKSGRRGDTAAKEEDDETMQGSLVSNIPENEFEMGPNLEDEDYLNIVATPDLNYGAARILYLGSDFDARLLSNWVKLGQVIKLRTFRIQLCRGGTKFVAETLPSSSGPTLLGSDVLIDNPFRLLLSGNEADSETLLDSSHHADLLDRKED
ncbi:hypothetical protein JTB14_005776, partial [Gonioctena quinquepunctata]